VMDFCDFCVLRVSARVGAIRGSLLGFWRTLRAIGAFCSAVSARSAGRPSAGVGAVGGVGAGGGRRLGRRARVRIRVSVELIRID
jgi:hypothetical protein